MAEDNKDPHYIIGAAVIFFLALIIFFKGPASIWESTLIFTGKVTGCDTDGDGYTDESCGGSDCNDADPNVNPGASESCTDGVDNDCNGNSDASDSGCDDCDDLDGDGYMEEGDCCTTSCDCDDANSGINPGASEACDDGVDNDCDGGSDSSDVNSCPPCVDDPTLPQCTAYGCNPSFGPCEAYGGP